MRSFSTYGRVQPEQYYIVSRTEEVTDFINRLKAGRYIVLFAPRQTGKTTFFRLALDALATEDPTYFPIQLDFQTRSTFPCQPICTNSHRGDRYPENRGDHDGTFFKRTRRVIAGTEHQHHASDD